MWVFIAIIIGIVVLSAIAKAYNNQLMSNLSTNFPAELQRTLKEEFPSFSHEFTMSKCHRIWDKSMAMAKRRTGKTDEAEAMLELSKKVKDEQFCRAYEDESMEFMLDTFSSEFRAFIEQSDENYEILKDAIGAASSIAVQKSK